MPPRSPTRGRRCVQLHPSPPHHAASSLLQAATRAALLKAVRALQASIEHKVPTEFRALTETGLWLAAATRARARALADTLLCK